MRKPPDQNILECTWILDLYILENCKSMYTWKSAKMLQKVLEYTGFSMTKIAGHPEETPEKVIENSSNKE